MSKVYNIITDRVIELLEQGVAPWRRPWGGGFQMPRNLISGKDYRGINVFMLACSGYASPYWLTFKQAKDLGGHVKKGEKSTPVVFWKQWDREDEDGEINKLPILRFYAAFNAQQCELPEGKLPPVAAPQFDFSPIERCEAVVRGYRRPPSIVADRDKACYRPSFDEVWMPPQTSFNQREAYYSTLFHELGHSTGHPERLNRKGIAEAVHFGDATYGAEELVAEMSAAFLCGHCGIETATLENSAAYLNNWLLAIKKDARLVVTAAAQAQKAADHILGRKWD